jgi:hypothetical protein
MNLIKKNLHRTDYLCLNLSGEHIKKFSSTSDCPSSTPLLQELHVHCPDGVRDSSLLKLSTTLPRPRTAHAFSYYANSLEIMCLFHTQGNNHPLLPCQRQNASSTLPCISMGKTLRPSYPNTPIVRQSIRHLTLSGVEAVDTIFPCSTMTSLTTLFISDFTEFFEISPGFAPFLRQSPCPLRCLEISFANRFTGDTLINTDKCSVKEPDAPRTISH